MGLIPSRYRYTPDAILVNQEPSKYPHEMDKTSINKEMKESHKAFTDRVKGLTEEEYHAHQDGKWHAGQHIDHIHKSVEMLSKAMRLPKWLVKWKFGTANRPSRDYDGLVQRYRERLEMASGNGIDSPVNTQALNFVERNTHSAQLMASVNRLVRRMDRYSEEELDKMILPHPLMGKLTLREMMYFTVYHVKHHHEIVNREVKRTQV